MGSPINPLQIIRDSIRLTLHTGSLWILAFLLYLVMIPAFLLSGGFGVVTYSMMMTGNESLTFDFLAPVRNLPVGGWVLYITLTLVLLSVSSLLTWAVQAAIIRAADAAADGKPMSVIQSLRLGKQRWGSLAKLALTFGVGIQALGILPPLLAIIPGKNTAWGLALLQLLQTFVTPVSVILGILVFLLTMSIALEDIRPRMAIGRVWKLVRSGWWGFLIAYVFQGILALAIAFMFAVVLTVSLLILMLGVSTQSTAEVILAGVICVVTSPMGLLILTFALVFSSVFFTLIYRAAAMEAAGTDSHLAE
jgi:hypothetical protein